MDGQIIHLEMNSCALNFPKRKAAKNLMYVKKRSILRRFNYQL